MWKDRRPLRNGEKLIHHRKRGVQTLGLVLAELKCIVILHSPIIIGLRLTYPAEIEVVIQRVAESPEEAK